MQSVIDRLVVTFCTAESKVLSWRLSRFNITGIKNPENCIRKHGARQIYRSVFVEKSASLQSDTRLMRPGRVNPNSEVTAFKIKTKS